MTEVSITCLAVLGEGHSGMVGERAESPAELLRAKDVDIGVQWRVTAEQKNLHTEALATLAC